MSDCMVLMSKCASETTHHGLNHVVNAKRRANRLFWLLVVGCSYILFLFHISKLLSRFLSSPVSTTIQYKAVQFRFPDVTVCNLMPLSMRMVEQNFGNASFIADLTDADEINQLIEQTVLRKHDFIVHCSFNEQRCNLKTAFTIIDDTSYKHCYLFRPHTRYPKKREPKSGLNLILFTDSVHNHSLPSINLPGAPMDSTGVHVVVHEPFTHPHPAVRGFNLAPGSSADIALTMEEVVQINTAEKRCVDERRNVTYCSFHTPHRSTYLGSEEDCTIERIQQQILRQCGCISENFQVPVQYCDTADTLHCGSSDDSASCEERVIWQLNAGFIEEVAKECASFCNLTQWSASVGTAHWPSSTAYGDVLQAVKYAYQLSVADEAAGGKTPRSALDELASVEHNETVLPYMLHANMVRLSVHPASLSGNRVVEEFGVPCHQSAQRNRRHPGTLAWLQRAHFLRTRLACLLRPRFLL